LLTKRLSRASESKTIEQNIHFILERKNVFKRSSSQANYMIGIPRNI
jgi:hypothetical protein